MWSECYHSEWWPLLMSHHPVTFGSRGHGECGDMLLFICQVTSHNHVIKGSCNFLCSNPLSEVPTPSHLVAIGLLEVDTCLFICYVTSCDKMIKDSFEFLCCNPLSQATTLSSFFCHLTTFYTSSKGHMNLLVVNPHLYSPPAKCRGWNLGKLR